MSLSNMQYGSSVATYEGVTNLEHHRRTQHVSHIRPLPGTVVHTKPIMATSTYHGLPPFKIKWAHYPLLWRQCHLKGVHLI